MIRRQLLMGLLGLLLAGPARGADGQGSDGQVIKIYKGARRLELWVDGVWVESFSVGLGGAPAGDKARQGDLRTPEGTFYVAWKNPRSQFHLFLGLSYPMPRHARAAWEAGRVSREVYEAVRSAVKRRGIPPQRTRLGGYVGIHGGGAGSDWTLGCIALSDADVERLYQRVRRGDRVEVYP
ncbi:MAG: L,D-transpeptidase family protein [Myxococcales bacterium]|nr:L,D-transpeptidase family protein [Myxococcales bacterium]